jgi:hypothetical protein
MALKAMFGAKLLARMSVADKAEATLAYLTARYARCSNGPSLLAHGRGPLTGVNPPKSSAAFHVGTLNTCTRGFAPRRDPVLRQLPQFASLPHTDTQAIRWSRELISARINTSNRSQQARLLCIQRACSTSPIFQRELMLAAGPSRKEKSPDQ